MLSDMPAAMSRVPRFDHGQLGDRAFPDRRRTFRPPIVDRTEGLSEFVGRVVFERRSDDVVAHAESGPGNLAKAPRQNVKVMPIGFRIPQPRDRRVEDGA